MAKTLKQFKELYEPKAADEKKFVDKHVVKKQKDQNGNDDKLFNASNVKPVKRATEHGYETAGQHDDEKVYESAHIEEKKLTPAEMKKREEIAKAIEREHPGMPKPKKMAIATATAKKVAEDIEQMEEAEKIAKHRPGWMLRSDKKIGDAAKQAKKINQLTAKFGGKPEAGKSVKEEITSVEKAKQTNDAMKKAATERADAEKARMERVREMAKKALARAKKLKSGESFSASVKRSTKEDIDFDAVREYLRTVYKDRLDESDQQALNEMLETDEGTKLAFIITYFSEE